LDNQTFTLTFGDMAENHKGMQKIGSFLNSGYNLSDMLDIYQKFIEIHAKTRFLTLNNNAYVLVVEQGLINLLGNNGYQILINEQLSLEKDTKAFMYGKVVNKHARHNLCFGESNQEPDYKNGKGRVYAFNDLPQLNNLKKKLMKLHKKNKNIVAEGNYYYDINKCGIGYHGDTERKIVIGVRLGESLPLYYRWYKKNNHFGPTYKIRLNGGDIYFMSEKATGNDWKKSKIATLRHATGCEKFTSE
jgi:hypothetical protein